MVLIVSPVGLRHYGDAQNGVGVQGSDGALVKVRGAQCRTLRGESNGDDDVTRGWSTVAGMAVEGSSVGNGRIAFSARRKRERGVNSRDGWKRPRGTP